MTHSQPQQGFLALPATGHGPGVLVLHAWWGLNETIKAFCTRLAEAGFVAFAPDLYHGQVVDTITAAEELAQALDGNHLQAKDEIVAAMQFLHGRANPTNQGLAVVGFSLGAYYALSLAADQPDTIRKVVLFYGTGGADFSSSRAAYLGHFAARDEFEPLANVEALAAELRAFGRPVTFHHYPNTGHWFFEPDRVSAYDPTAADLAWERTLVFLQQSMG